MTQIRVKAGSSDQPPARRIIKDAFGLEGLIVESKTMGTNMVYNLSPRNFSRTGMLLSSGRYKKLPFKVNTLLEMTIDTRGVLFAKPVQVLGKVVRLENGSGEESEHVRFGVQILQMENDAMDRWEDRMTALEASAERLLTATSL